MPINRIRAAAYVAFIHFLGCLAVASLSAIIVFWLWFPSPFDKIEGGRELLILIVTVDVICGPLLTLVVFNPYKSRRELTVDLFAIVIVQLLALAYGLNTAAAARPVLLAFEQDRFQVVRAEDVNPEDLGHAEKDLRRLSFTGPRIISIQVPGPSDPGYLASIELSLKGFPPYVRPELWRPYDASRKKVLARLKSLDSLKKANLKNAKMIDDAIKKTGLSERSLGYLSIVGRSGSSWIAILSTDDAEVVAFAEIEDS